MAVVHCKEVTGRGADQTKKSVRRYTRIFQILTSSGTDGSKTVLAHPELPALGDAWEEVTNGVQTDLDPSARCVEKRATQTDGENHQNWMVYCEYTGLFDPLLEPPDVDWGGEKYQESTRKDIAGRLYANAAGDPYESGLIRDRNRRVLTIRRNVLTWNPVEEDQYVDTLNELAFLVGRHPPGFAARLCKIDEISAVPVFFEHYPDDVDPHYYRKTVKVSIDRRGWDDAPLNYGRRALLFNDILGIFEPVKIPDRGGATGGPILLAATGVKLAAGAAETYIDPPFKKYETKDWTPLALEY